MHGKYKVPDGRLVVVDPDAVDGKLSQVVVSGDLFLEPDESLDDIVRALTGLPYTSSIAGLAVATNLCLSKDARLLGFFPEAVGIAMRHALGYATNWDDHTSDVTGPVILDPRLYVASDEVLAARMARGEIGPSLRIWDQDQPLVVTDSFQNYRNEIDEEGHECHGINVMRRITGGGAMFMEPGNCVTYSLLVPGFLVEGLNLERSYEFLDQWAVGALVELGVMARHVPPNDIASNKGKIAGAAQRRLTSGVVLHHVMMVYDIDTSKMLQVLRIGREKLSDKRTKSANKCADPLRSQTQLSRDQIIDSFLKHFESYYSTHRRNHTDDEFAAAVELMEEKFAILEWTRRIP